MPQYYDGLILTKHAQERAKMRGISQQEIFRTIAQPKKRKAVDQEKYKFIRDLDSRTLHVVATYKPDQKIWLVISVWVRGEDDPQPLILTIVTLPFKLIRWLLKPKK